MPDGVDPDEVTALLAVPLEEFVATRTARAKALRAEGRREEAAALAKVRKPVRLVWVVGELARRHPDQAEDAAAVAEELEAAQAGGSGVRPLLKRFRDVVGGLAATAGELGDTVDVMEVGLALREVLADPDARDDWLAGRLLALPGEDDAGAPPPDELAPRRAAREAASRSRRKADADADGAAGDAEDDEARRAAEEEAAARAEARRVAEETVATAEAELETAEAARAEAVARVEAMEEQLERLVLRVEEARQQLEDDDALTEELRTAAEQARAALAELDDDGDDRGRPTRRTKRRR